MRIASVILDIPTQSLDSPYSYLVPEEALLDSADAVDVDCAVAVGCAVLVPFGHRKAVGYVIGLHDNDDGAAPSGASAVDPEKLKPIERVLSKPYFDEMGAACAQFLAHEYVAPLSSCIRLFVPPGGVPRMVRSRAGYWRLEEPSVGEVDDRWVVPGDEFASFAPRKTAVKQQAIMQALERGPLRVIDLSSQLGSVSSSLKALEKQHVVRIEHRRRMRAPEMPVASAWTGTAGGGYSDQGCLSSGDGQDPADPPSPSYAARPVLTAGQQHALEVIESCRASREGDVVLVDGVTGSGKTEVYLRAIEQTLREGRSAIVLVPEISLTPQTVARFRGRFGDQVAVMHSRMSHGERYDQWDVIRSGQAKVVVGARSALFTPLKDVGLIVIDEEHEGSYKQDSAPRYQARDVAAWMVRQSHGVLVLGSATPSIDSLYRCAKLPHWHHVELPERANGKALPKIEIVDMAAEFRSGSRAMFSSALVRALSEELSQGRKAVLLLNQRGFAKFLLCRDCGYVPTCPSCSTSLTYHERERRLICHHCGHSEPVPAVCPACNSPYLKKFGAGTQRVEMELRILLDELPQVGPRVPIIRMDADTTRTKGAHQRLLEEFAAEDAAVLLGTQMIAKGLDFDDVTLVGVINADTQLHLPDYRAGERTFNLIEQVAGRAGRASLPGRVLVQTYEADDVAIRAAARYDRPMFLRSELPKRKLLGYPPYVRLANVLIWGKDESKVSRHAMALYDLLVALMQQYGNEHWQVLAPSPCVLEKLRGNYRWHIVVKCPLPASDDLPGLMGRLFRTRKAEPQVNAAVDIDPVDLL